jgi:hypothetical protein
LNLETELVSDIIRAYNFLLEQVRLLDSVDACLPHPNKDVQEQAGKALHGLMRSYFPVLAAKGPSDRLQKRVVDKYVKEVQTSINPAATRGFSLALGCLPAKLLAPSLKVLDICFSCLCRASHPDAKVGNDKDAETRRNSLVALARICDTVGIQSSSDENEYIVGATPKQVENVLEAFFRGLNDYNMERRGDVGSMSRIAAMRGLETLTLVTSRTTQLESEYFTQATCIKMIGGLLKQLAEKLDAVRSEAGSCLLRILKQSDPPIPHIPQKDCLLKALKCDTSSEEDDHSNNWADASFTFPLVVKALEIGEFFEYIISGLVISVGALTQSVAKHASGALLQWVKDSQDGCIHRLGGGEILLRRPRVLLNFSLIELAVFVFQRF